MRRFPVHCLLLIVAGWVAPATRGQVVAPPGGEPAQVIVDPEHAKQLETCQAGLLDPAARDEDRRRWADLLLSYDSPAARAMVVELLRRSDRPGVQRTLCRAIGDKAQVAPERIDASFAAPILELLGAETEILRTTAARTLADFPGSGVPDRLGRIAANPDGPLSQRLSAVDALAPNTHRREVVGQLIPLLESGVPAIVERTAAALAPAARGNIGKDVASWIAWWDIRSQWREEDWLAEQLEIYRRRSRQLAQDFEAYRREVQESNSAIESQFKSFQHELFRALPAEQRDTRLVEWLNSPIPLTNDTALAIIQARIADEGKRPEGEVLAALLRLMQKATGETQRRALQIAQTLNDPMVVEAMLKLLDRERQPKSRHAILAAIGKLDSPQAVPALIREIADDQAPRECVREAAIALGSIAGRSDAQSIEIDAVEPLKRRYATLGTESNGLRAALISAMAGLAMPAFAPELLEGLESEDATILQPALRGLLRLRDATKIGRFRSLTGHADPQVRLAAVQGLAELGSDDTDMATLLSRLNPNVESNQPVREAAWRGFLSFVERRPLPERIRAARGLREMPALELQYLTELADDLPQSAASPGDAATILDMLAVSLASQGKYGDAAARWRQLLEAGVAPGDASGLLTPAVRWLEAALQAPEAGALKDVLKRIGTLAQEQPDRDRVTTAVRRYLDSTEFSSDPERAKTLVDVLKTHGFAEWREMLDDKTVVGAAPDSREDEKPQ